MGLRLIQVDQDRRQMWGGLQSAAGLQPRISPVLGCSSTERCTVIVESLQPAPVELK
jgi:hypothetical protein